MLSCAAALALALFLGAPSAAPPVAALAESAFGRRADLSLQGVGRLLSDPRPAAIAATRAEARAADAGPLCLADVCPSVVAVPGFEPRYNRVSRTELVVAGLQRARIKPLATVAWALYATGLRLDWAPPLFDTNANAHGWGSVMLRLRVRIDARNHLVFPKKPSAG
jgi:hypothetical protein